MYKLKEIPEWMDQYIPALMKQWDKSIKCESSFDIEQYAMSLMPNMKDGFIIFMNIKIELLKILNEDYVLG